MSSELADVNVYSSPLTVVSVKLELSDFKVLPHTNTTIVCWILKNFVKKLSLKKNNYKQRKQRQYTGVKIQQLETGTL